MANATWPASLPQDLEQAGHFEAAPDTVIRSEMSTGAQKIRRRFTAAPVPIPGKQLMTTAQVATLRTFYVTTLGGGALPFDWKLPRTGTTTTFRFLKPPKWSPASPLWEVQLALEAMP
jgi:hypothetical protein